MAGYYRTVMHAPLTILPINRLEDRVPLQFDMTLAVPRGRPDIKAAIETAVAQHKAEIQAILADFGVPLVRCDECTVSGDLPSHGPYQPIEPHVQTAAATPRQRAARMAELKKWLKEGANPDDELNNAIVAHDPDRVRYLATHGANVNSQDGAGYTPLISATRSGFADVATFLAEHEADPNLTDSSGWTPLMWAAWGDDPALAKMLLSHGARLDSVDKDGLTPLGIAARNGKLEATVALLDAGADVAAVDYTKISPLDLVKSTPQGKLVNPYKDTQEDIVASGQKGLLHYSCSGCHGGGGGGGICPALTNDIWVYGGDDDTLFRLVTLGSDELQKAGYARKGRENVVAPMPPFGAIIPNADDLWKIIAFIRSRYSGDPAYKFGTPAPET
jgi:mono/diheme cytochrome c family protein